MTHDNIVIATSGTFVFSFWYSLYRYWNWLYEPEVHA